MSGDDLHHEVEARPRPAWYQRPQLWVATTYFAEGFPYTVVNSLAEILFKELGASLQVVGLTSIFHLPWNLKFLWGPFVDGYETKRRWLLATEVALVVALVALGLLAAGRGVALTSLAIGFLVLALLSTTHDIAIDGLYLEALDGDDQSKYVGVRSAAYRVAMLAVQGPLVAVCALAGWTFGLMLAAAIMAAFVVVHAISLPRIEQPRAPWAKLAAAALRWRTLSFVLAAALVVVLERGWAVATDLQLRYQRLERELAWVDAIGIGGWVGIGLLAALLILLALLPIARRRLDAARERGELSDYATSFVSFLDQPKIGVMLAFVVLFRTGESFLQKMKWPFFDDVVELPLEHYAMTNGTVGLIASIAATLVGGYLIGRDGLRRWIWPFVLAQNLLNLLYMGLAIAPAPTELGLGVVAAVIVLEHVGAGLGTAVFMVYLMRTCDPGHKAGHFAIVSALMSLSFTLAGVFSGVLAEAFGFANYFGFTFVATIPGMLLIFFIPHLDGRETSAS